MADGRRCEEWDHSLLHSMAMGAKGVNLETMNPYRREHEDELTPEQEKAERKAKMAAYAGTVVKKGGQRGTRKR